MPANVGSAVGYLDLDISGFVTGLKTAQSEAQKTSRTLSQTLGTSMQSVGKKMTSVGSTLTKTVTVPIVGLGTAAVKTSATFESAMSRVAAISGATGDELDSLNEKAQELGASTSYTASEVADGMTEMAKAGWSSQQIIDGMAGVLNAATASGESLASVSTIVADAITGFCMEAKDATRIADLLTQAANAGTIDIVDLGESFKYVAPLASTMGFSVEDITTALSAMSTAGIKGSQAGTSLRTVFSRLTKPTKAVQTAMDELNISIANQDGTFKSLDQILSEMRVSFSNMTDEQKAYYATVLAGQEGQSGLLSMLNMTQQEYDAIAESMDNCNGVAEETSKVMLDNLSGQLTILKSALEGLAIQFGEIMLPYLKSFVEWIQRIVQRLQQMSDAEKRHIIRLAGFAAAIGPVLLVFGKLVSTVGGFIKTIGRIPKAISTVTGIVSKLSTGFTSLGQGILTAKANLPAMISNFSGLSVTIGGITAPLAAVVALVIGLGAAFTTLLRTNEDFRKKLSEIWGGLVDKLNEAGKKITEALNSLGFNFSDIIDVISSLWEGLCNTLGPVFIGVIQTIASALEGIIDVITGVIQVITGIIKGFKDGDWSLFVEGLQSIFLGFIQFITSPLRGLFEMFNGFLTSFGIKWEEFWSGLVKFFSDTWKGVKTFFSDLWDSLVDIVSGAFEAIKNVVVLGFLLIKETISYAFQMITLPFMLIWENCKEIITSAWESIKTTIGDALNHINVNIITPIMTTIQETFTNFWNTISSFITEVWTTIQTNVTNAINTVKERISAIFEEIRAIIQNVMNTISGVISDVWEGIKSTVSGAVNYVKDIITTGFNAVSSTISGVLNGIKNTFTSVFNGIKDFVGGIVDWLKGIFDFNWSLPKIKLPHFKITGEFSLMPPSVPHIGIDWYKKAMSNGMILDSPTLFGFDTSTGKFLGGGEAGSETVVGTQSLMSMINQTVANTLSSVLGSSNQLDAGDIVIPVYIGNEMLDTLVVKAINRNNYRSGGK